MPQILGADEAAPSTIPSFRKKLGDRSSQEDFDWQVPVFVLVRWRLPLKMIRVDPANAAYDFDTCLERAKRIAINYVELGAATQFTGELVKSWLKERFTKICPRKFEFI